MNEAIFAAFMEAQKKAIELYKWQEGERRGCDPGQEAIQEWITKYAKKFRKEFILSDLKEALNELSIIRQHIQSYLDKISELNKVIDECEKKIITSLELFE